MEGSNCLRMDVVGCLTSSPRITKSPNPSLVQDPVFMHVLIKIIKPVDIGDQSHLKFPDDWWRLQISCYLLPLPYPQICQSTHTHTYACTCLHNIFTPVHNTLEMRFCRAQWGSELGNIKSSTILRDRWRENDFSSVDNAFPLSLSGIGVEWYYTLDVEKTKVWRELINLFLK